MKRTLTTEQLRERAEALRGEALGWANKGFSFESQRLSETAAALDELADIREMQPVALVDRRPAASGSICWQNSGKDLLRGTELFTAPPAPAVPDALVNDIDSDDHPLLWSYNNGWNACRAAMLTQPVSSGYKLPDGFKLMPLEMTDEIGEAIAMEARCCGGIALCIYEAALAAAPEGGN